MMSAMSEKSRRTGLWGHADFLRLWSAQAISAIASRITRTALPIIAIQVLHQADGAADHRDPSSPSSGRRCRSSRSKFSIKRTALPIIAIQVLHQAETTIAFMWALYLVPGLALALFAGGFVDRNRKRRILIASDLFRAACVASISIAWELDALTMTQLIVVGMLVGAASALFQIADVAYLPSLIGKRQLADGNAKLEATEGVAEVSGPAGAGLLIGILGAPLAVIVDAASYVWSAIMLGRIQTIELPPEPTPTAESSTWQSRRDLRIGMQAVFGHAEVRPVVSAMILWSSVGGCFTSLYALFVLRTVGLSSLMFGIIVAVGGVGSLAGAFISRLLVARIGLGPALIWCAVISTVAHLLIPLAQGPTWMRVAFLSAHQLIGDCFAVAFTIQAVTLRQTVLPRAVLGRANAAVHNATAGPVPIFAIAAGVFAQLTSIRTGIWVGMSLGLLVPLFLLPLRNLKLMPEAASSSVHLPAASASDLRLPTTT